MLKGEGALIKCSLYIAREVHPDSSSLLALARCTPLTAQVHRGEWETITSPLQISVWEKGFCVTQIGGLQSMCAMGSGRDSEWVLTTEAPIADKHQAI